jgi:hypothetical protein
VRIGAREVRAVLALVVIAVLANPSVARRDRTVTGDVIKAARFLQAFPPR